MNISIHAPTRGATRWTSLLCRFMGDFNPRSHKGSDGGWLHALNNLIHFNPRSHKGSDQDMEKCDYQCKISIHAPTRGATTSVAGIPEVEGISIHAPTRGATKRMYKSCHLQEISIHAPTRGATHPQLITFPEVRISIHAPTRGATVTLEDYAVELNDFNPRSHKGSDQKNRYNRR